MFKEFGEREFKQQMAYHSSLLSLNVSNHLDEPWYFFESMHPILSFFVGVSLSPILLFLSERKNKRCVEGNAAQGHSYDFLPPPLRYICECFFHVFYIGGHGVFCAGYRFFIGGCITVCFFMGCDVYSFLGLGVCNMSPYKNIYGEVDIYG